MFIHMNKVSFNDPWHAVSFIYFFHECAQTEKVIFLSKVLPKSL